MDNVYASLSTLAYELDADKRNEKARALGYTLDPELSDDDAAVFYKGDGAVVAYRGTNPTNMDDLSADFSIVKGTQASHHRFMAAETKALKAAAKYRNIHLTGHSLGGSLANHTSMKHGYAGTVFNPGSNPFYKNKQSKNVQVYRNADDLISHGFKTSKIVKRKPGVADRVLAKYDNTFTSLGKQFLNHSLAQFVV